MIITMDQYTAISTLGLGTVISLILIGFLIKINYDMLKCIKENSTYLVEQGKVRCNDHEETKLLMVDMRKSLDNYCIEVIRAGGKKE